MGVHSLSYVEENQDTVKRCCYLSVYLPLSRLCCLAYQWKRLLPERLAVEGAESTNRQKQDGAIKDQGVVRGKDQLTTHLRSPWQHWGRCKIED